MPHTTVRHPLPNTPRRGSMSIVRSRRAGTAALVAATVVAAAACGASPRAEREVAARNAAILRAGSAGSAATDSAAPGAAAGATSLSDAAAGSTASGGGADQSATGSDLDKYSQVAEQAASAYFKYVNDHGGVFGRKIEYVPCDTAGTADGTQGCLRKLANDDKVFAMGPSLDFNLDTVPTFLADKK